MSPLYTHLRLSLKVTKERGGKTIEEWVRRRRKTKYELKGNEGKKAEWRGDGKKNEELRRFTISFYFWAHIRRNITQSQRGQYTKRTILNFLKCSKWWSNVWKSHVHPWVASPSLATPRSGQCGRAEGWVMGDSDPSRLVWTACWGREWPEGSDGVDAAREAWGRGRGRRRWRREERLQGFSRHHLHHGARPYMWKTKWKRRQERRKWRRWWKEKVKTKKDKSV